MILVASANGDVGMAAGMEILRAGGSALDAVEAATREVEANTADHTVGVGGFPNAAGEVELDASLMDGTTRRAGAVAALKGYPHPISVARAILEHLPEHVLLVGTGAAQFAAERGFALMNLLTEEAEGAWRRQLNGLSAQQLYAETFPAEAVSAEEQDMIALARSLADPARAAGTVNFLAQDHAGRIAGAVSTSGWAFKYPGRVGDSPVFGAGNYCDDRWGACACTGLGEWAIRSATAHRVVLGLEYGLPLAQACHQAMQDLDSIPLSAGLEPVMNLVALDNRGHHAGWSTHPGRAYLWQTPEMREFATAPRTQRASG